MQRRERSPFLFKSCGTTVEKVGFDVDGPDEGSDEDGDADGAESDTASPSQPSHTRRKTKTVARVSTLERWIARPAGDRKVEPLPIAPS